MRKKQVGIFSGSFNPIHIGHLILANYMLEFTYLDEVWFLVTPHNPLKEAESLLGDNIRLEMTRLAVKDFDRLLAEEYRQVGLLEAGVGLAQMSLHLADQLRVGGHCGNPQGALVEG